MERKPQKTEEMIIDDLHEGVRELGELTTDTTTRLGEKAISAIRRLEKAIPAAKERWSSWKDGLSNHAKDAGDHIDQFAKDQPWKLVGWAAGLGFIVGLLFSGGDDSKDD